MKTLSEQLSCLKRELALRQRVYPKWVLVDKMTPAKAAHEIECIEACVKTVEKVLTIREISEEMKRDYLTRNPPESRS